ncbi:MAG: hypothetical protein Q4G08_01350 [Capnocytophaga sp.]|nr:hypothetical protein [Capnocytophaga sp.]
MKKTIRLSFLLFLSVLIGCTNDSNEPDAPASGTFDVTFEDGLQNTVYPSVIFGLAEVEKQTNQAIDFFDVHFTADNATNIRVTVQESALNYETVVTQQVSQGSNTFSPKLKWKYDALRYMAQPGYTDVTFVCEDSSGKEIGRKNMKVSYRAINECVLAARLNNQTYPLFFLLGSYVNEDSPVIDAFLKDVLDMTSLNAFTGYQLGTEESVWQQVAAMFYTLRAKGVKYSSITDTSSGNPNVVSQYIRFADEMVANTQANCADGTVFLCGALRKIGLHPVMVFQPGHVYLGYYTDETKRNFYLLETTMIGGSASFEDATMANVQHFNSKINEYNNGDYFDMYFTIAIDAIRPIVKPIGR